MSSGAIFRFVGWNYLPDFATRQALRVLHQILFHVFKRAPPPPRTPAYALHYRFVFAAVVLCYLTYNFIDASGDLPRNYYELLGVYPHTTESHLKVAFRAFAKKYHPDRTGPQGESFFIDVRDAFDALKNPVTRFAYDRFGPDALKWTDCTTTREFLRRGLLNSSVYHAVTGVVLVLFSRLGRPSPVAAWRYLLFLALFASELYLILSPSPVASSPAAALFIDVTTPTRTILDMLFPRRVVYQHILFLHQIFFFVSVALSRVAPVLFPSLTKNDPSVDQHLVRAMAERMGSLAKSVERELSIILNIELHSLHDSRLDLTSDALKPPKKLREETMDALSREMENMIIENKLGREVGPAKSVWEAAIQKDRRETRKFGFSDKPSLPLADFLPSKGRYLRGRSMSL
ncbi:DnaJ-domain-containing protein [Hygrophoropsis aurantiaca]|uniref:DnaJ-domain-containing protein n=1 Tax=Hygrophoropsis aurantiaca TaxID=72124 RepID=A0ACB8ADI7_9AGAM|nr:DnaJ-domain-containing protein [Hygrophoropsis aurantiaca]